MDKSNLENVQSPPSQLEYAPQPSVGDLTLSRRDGIATIFVNAGWRRMLRVSWGLCVALSIASLGVMFVPMSSVRLDPSPIVIAAVFVILLFVASGKALLITARGHRWVVAPTQLEFIGRRLTEVYREVYPRSMIADIRVERVRLKNNLLRYLRLTIVKPDGTRIAILWGKRSELDFARQVFAEVLNIPADPLNELKYPKLKWWYRVKKRAMLGGVIVTLHPRVFGWIAMLVFLVGMSGIVAGDYSLYQTYPKLLTTTFGAWGMFRVLVCMLILSGAVLRAEGKLRKAITVAVSERGLGLHERSLFSPCSEEWPIDQIDQVFMHNSATDRSSNLMLRLSDGSEISLIARESRSNVELVLNILHQGMSRPPVPPTPVIPVA